MELDETDPAIWLKLEGATQDYIQNNSTAFKTLAERLLESTHDEKFDSLKSQNAFRGKGTKISFNSYFILFTFLKPYAIFSKIYGRAVFLYSVKRE